MPNKQSRTLSPPNVAETRGHGPIVRPRSKPIEKYRQDPADYQDYFSAHGADALLIANQVYKTNNVIKYLGSGLPSNRPTASTSHSAITARGLPSVTISMALTKLFLREALTTKQMRVEIYEAQEGAAGRKNNTAWLLAKEASPGNIAALEDMLFDKDDLVANAVSMAIKVSIKDGMRTVGCAFVDVQDKKVGVAQFDETENYSNTEVSANCHSLRGDDLSSVTMAETTRTD